jgi:hypothetical protein
VLQWIVTVSSTCLAYPPTGIEFPPQHRDSPREAELATKVNQLTSMDGYFAENQNYFEGLSNHIFRNLDQCVAFVGVMHHGAR